MVSKRVKTFLAAEALFCLCLCRPLAASGGGLGAAMAFPFMPLGKLLRLMSEAGPLGDACAWALYAVLCLLPAGYFFLRTRRGIEDGLLLVMSALLFFQMYYAVNPSLLKWPLNKAGSFGGSAMGCVFYALLTAYLVLRFIRVSMSAHQHTLMRCCKGLLAVLAAALVFGAFALSPAALVNVIGDVRAGNQGNESALTWTYVFLALGCGVRMSAYLLDLWVLETAAHLLDTWQRVPYTEDAVHAAGFLARRSGLSLIATVLLNLGYQLLQLVFMPVLYRVDMTVTVPLTSVALVLAALMLAQFLRESKQLKDDNDLFI